MTSNETVAAVRALRESYRDAFKRLDAAAIADHFAYSSHITGDADEVALLQLSNRQGCLAAVEKVVAMHRELEVPSGSIRELSIVELSPRLTLASLTMEVHRRSGGMLYDFGAVYTLAENARRMADRGHRAQSDSAATGMHGSASSRCVSRTRPPYFMTSVRSIAGDRRERLRAPVPGAVRRQQTDTERLHSPPAGRIP
jgi:hypothetical protein